MCILLDLDGTLTDPAPGITKSIQFALRACGYEVPPASSLTRFIGPPLKDTFVELVPDGDEAIWSRLVDSYRERFSDVGLYENEVYPGIPEALVRLRARGIKLLVATSKPTIFAKKIVEHFGLNQYIEAIHGSDLDGGLSHKADLIAHVLLAHRLESSRVLMVGDRKHDVAGACQNGVVAAGVLWGYGDRSELEAAGAHRLLARTEELGELELAKGE